MKTHSLPLVFRFALTSLFVWLLLGSSVQAGQEVTNDRAYLLGVTTPSVRVEDSRYNYMRIHPAWDDSLLDRHLVNRVTLGIDPTRVKASDGTFSYSVTLEINATKWNGTSFFTETYNNITLNIDYAPSGDYRRIDYFLFTEAYAFDVRVVSTTGGLSEAVYLEGESTVDRYYPYDLSLVPEGGDLKRIVQENQVSLEWPFMRGAQAYDLEWVYIDSVNQSSVGASGFAYDFDEEAVRVRVTQPEFAFPLLFNPGFVLFRYRPVYFDSTTFRPEVEGPWSTDRVGLGSRGNVGSFLNHATSSGDSSYNRAWHVIETRFDPLRNWNGTSVFTEDGKAMHAVSYADGLGRTRQSQVSNPDIQQVMASAPLFDAEGRPSVSVLPAPVNRYDFGYIDSLNLSADSALPYNWRKFEPDALFDTANCRYNYVRMHDADSWGAARYYSEHNPDQEGFQAFVPDADSVPFLITRYMPDNTGRIYSMGGGFGSEFQPLDGREIQFRYDQVTDADLAAYFENDDRGDSRFYKRKHVIDQNGQRSVIYQDANDRVILSSLSGSAPANLDTLDGSSVNDPRVADLTAFNALEDGSWQLEYQQFVTPNQAYILDYRVTVPQFADSCDPSISICYDCVYDVDIRVTYEDECFPSKRYTAYEEAHRLGMFKAAVDSCTGDTTFLLAGDGDTSIIFPYNTMMYVTKTLTLNDSAAQAFADHYVQESGCVASLEDVFRDAFRTLAPQLDSCESDPCRAQCYSELGSFESFFWDSVMNLGPDPLPIDTSAVRTHYDSLVDACALFCSTGWDKGLTRCEQLEAALIAQFEPGNLYAGFDTAFAGTNSHSIFSASNVFGFNYQDTTLDYRQPNGAPYPDKSTGPWSYSLQNFILSFQGQWAEAIYRHIRDNGNLPAEAQCYIDICSDSAAVFDYEAILRSLSGYEQALFVRHAPNDSGFFMNPANWDTASSYYTTPGCCLGADQYDPLLSHPVIGPLLLNYVRDPFGANDTLNLYQTAHRIVRANQGTSPYDIGVDTCFMDREWRMFRDLYIGERERLMDSLYYNCATDTVPFTLGFIMRGTLNPSDTLKILTDGVDTADLRSYYQAHLASRCDSSCEALAISWIDQLDTCVSDTAVLNALMADFVALCQASCDPSNPFGATSLPDSANVILGGAAGTQPIDTVPASVPIMVNGTGPYNVSSFGDILYLYDSVYVSFNQSLYCNPYRIESLLPYRTSIPYPQLDSCSCVKVQAASSAFDSLQTAQALPQGITNKRQYFFYVHGAWLNSFPEAECVCDAATASGDLVMYLDSAAIPAPQGIGCTSCYTCSQLMTHYNAMLTDLNITAGNDTSDQVFELFRVYLLNNNTGIDQPSGLLTTFVRDCQSFDAENRVRLGLSPHAENLLVLLNEEFDRHRFAAGTYGLPLFHAYYRGSLYPHAFDTLADVQYTISGSPFSSLQWLLSNASGPAVADTIRFTGVSPANITLDSILTFTGIAANTQGVTSGDVFAFELTGISVSGTQFTVAGNSSYALFATITNAGSPEPLMCPDRYRTYKTADPCVDLLVEQALAQTANLLVADLDSVRNDFLQRYAGQCQAVQETSTLDYDANEYSSTLYYYAADGNLVQTVAPKGVVQGTPASHSFRTKYHYDSWNQLIASESPDGGRTRYWYNDRGQLVLSQNARQRADSTQFEGQWYYPMSYTQYDPLGRIIEVGELFGQFRNALQVFGVPERTPEAGLRALMQQPGFPRQSVTAQTGPGSANNFQWNVYRRQEVTRTFYTDPLAPATVAYFGADGQQYTARRVATVTFEELYTTDSLDYDYALHFSYDVHGNVRTVLTEDAFLRNFDLHLKRIDYDYELLSGNVREVAFQQGHVDARFHRYRYDANNRLEHVHTSTDRVVWEEDATYAYFDHGPLARTELGEEKVQGLDYVYTLQGWIKAMNSNTLVTGRDPGKDGDLSDDYQSDVPRVHANVAQDVFGYVLGYYEDDYRAIDGSKQNFEASLGGDFAYSGNLRELFNGNISSMVSALTQTNNEVLPVYGRGFDYDQLNRLKRQRSYTVSDVIGTNSWSGSSFTFDYRAVYSYDANGNLTNLKRNQKLGQGITGGIDDLFYGYGTGTNRLLAVRDPAGNVVPGLDIDANYGGGSQDSANFTYNAIGQLLSSEEDSIASIDWTVYGKVKRITRVSGCTWPDLEFRYDPFGNRIAKIEKPRTGGTADSSQYWRYTLYGNDASGMQHAVYEAQSQFATLQFAFHPDFTCNGNTHISIELTDTGFGTVTNSGTTECGSSQDGIDLLVNLLNTPPLAATYNSGTDSVTVYRTDGLPWQAPVLVICINGVCASYNLTLFDENTFDYRLSEQMLYGSSRLGTDQENTTLQFSRVEGDPTHGYDSLGAIQVPELRKVLLAGEVRLEMTGDTVATTPNIQVFAGGQLAQVPNAGDDRVTTTGTIRTVFDTLAARLGRSTVVDTMHVPGNDTALILLPVSGNSVAAQFAVYYRPENNFHLSLTRPDETEHFDHGRHQHGLSRYELSNHLGNVQNVVSNRRLSQRNVVFQDPVDNGTLSNPDYTSSNMGYNAGTGMIESSAPGAFFASDPTLFLGTYAAGFEYRIRFDLEVTSGSVTFTVSDSAGTTNLATQTYNAGTTGTQSVAFTAADNHIRVRWELGTDPGSSFSLDSIEIENGTPMWLAEVKSYMDYYPYGMLMPQRFGFAADGDYRYGFNGMETDPEMNGQFGQKYDFGARIDDPRLGRWLSPDKLSRPLPAESGYSFAGNNPIFYIDYGGYFRVSPDFARRYPTTVHILNAISSMVESGTFKQSNLFNSMLTILQTHDQGISSTAALSLMRSILKNGSGPYVSEADMPSLGLTSGDDLREHVSNYDVYLNQDVLDILEGIEAEGETRISLLNNDQIAAMLVVFETLLHEAIHVYLAGKGFDEEEAGVEAGNQFENVVNPVKFSRGDPNNTSRTLTQQQLDRGNDPSNYPFQLNRPGVFNFIMRANTRNDPVVKPGKEREKQTRSNRPRKKGGSHRTVRYL